MKNKIFIFMIMIILISFISFASILFTEPTEVSGSYINRSNILINVTSDDVNFANQTIYIYSSDKTLIYSNFSDLQNNFFEFNSISSNYDTICVINTANVSSACYDGGYYYNLNYWDNPLENIKIDDNDFDSFANSSYASVILNPRYEISPNLLSGTFYVWDDLGNHSYNLSETCIDESKKLGYINIVIFANNGNIGYSCKNFGGGTAQTFYSYSYWGEERDIYEIKIEIIDVGQTLYFNATSYDLSGNSNNTETRNVTIDIIPPTSARSANADYSQTPAKQGTYVITNITYIEKNLKNITFYLRNSTTNPVYIYTSYADTNYTFYNLAEGYWAWGVTICDKANTCVLNALGEKMIDSLIPTIVFENNTGLLGNGLVVNITSTDTNTLTSSLKIYNSTFHNIISKTFSNSLYDLIYGINTSSSITGTQTSLEATCNDDACGSGSIGYNFCDGDFTTYTSFADGNYVTYTFSEDIIKANMSIGGNIHELDLLGCANKKVIEVCRDSFAHSDDNLYVLCDSSCCSGTQLYTEANYNLYDVNVSTTITIYTISNFTDGIYYYNASTYDTAGNVNTTELRNFTINPVIPEQPTPETPEYDNDKTGVLAAGFAAIVIIGTVAVLIPAASLYCAAAVGLTAIGMVLILIF